MSFIADHVKALFFAIFFGQSINVSQQISYIGLAFGLVLLYRACRDIVRPHRSLDHIPHVNYFTTMLALVNQEQVSHYSQRVIQPILSKAEGLTLRPTRLGWSIFVTHPKMIKQILHKQLDFPKPEFFIASGEGTLLNKFIIGPNILFVPHVDWKRHRKIANPAFQQAIPCKVFGKLTKLMIQIIDGQLETNQSVEMCDLIYRLTLDALSLTGFGFDINSLGDPTNEWSTTYLSIFAEAQKPLYMLFPVIERWFLNLLPRRKRVHDECSRFQRMIDDLIESRRKAIQLAHEDEGIILQDATKEKDILTLLLESEKNEGDSNTYMTTEEIRSNFCLFFVAGHDTTMGSLTSAFYYLAAYKDVQQKAREEVLSVLGDNEKDGDIVPTQDQLKKMEYLNMIIKEVLRMHPPIPILSPRKAKEDCYLGNYFVPKDTLLLVDIFNAHRNPDTWDDPNTFNPERFRAGGEADKKTSGEGGSPWIPFSSGARLCIGMNLSLAEQRIVLSMMLRKYSWSLPKGSIHENEVVTKGLFFLTPKALEINFKARY